MSISHLRINGKYERFLTSLGTKQPTRYDLLQTVPLLHCDSRALLRNSYVQSLIAESLEIDKSHQTAIWHVERSKAAHTMVLFIFIQKCSIVKLEETML